MNMNIHLNLNMNTNEIMNTNMGMNVNMKMNMNLDMNLDMNRNRRPQKSFEEERQRRYPRRIEKKGKLLSSFCFQWINILPRVEVKSHLVEFLRSGEKASVKGNRDLV